MQYKKLFYESEIEYITPFIKLWISFNSWYKYNLKWIYIEVEKKNWEIKEKEIKTDKEAISYLKKEWELLNQFSILFKNNSNFCKNVKLYLSMESKDLDEKDFENILDKIYKVRCDLFHWDYDIEDSDFINLVQNSYNILYPIMENILKQEENRHYFDENYFIHLENRIKDLILLDITPTRKIIELYTTSIDYIQQPDHVYWKIQNSLYLTLFWKSIKKFREEISLKRTDKLFDNLSDSKKDIFNKKVLDFLFLWIEKAKEKKSMTMKDWEKEFTKK